MSLWNRCLERLQQDLPTQQFSMWIRPLVANEESGAITLFAPNRFVLDWVRDKYIAQIEALFVEFCTNDAVPQLRIEVKSATNNVQQSNPASVATASTSSVVENSIKSLQKHQTARSSASSQTETNSATPNAKLAASHKSNINFNYKFDNFVEGKSNQLARAASKQVSDNPGKAYNPLFIYGGTGLGKTHLLHAVGNGIIDNKNDATVVYMHSERFVQDLSLIHISEPTRPY